MGNFEGNIKIQIPVRHDNIDFIKAASDFKLDFNEKRGKVKKVNSEDMMKPMEKWLSMHKNGDVMAKEPDKNEDYIFKSSKCEMMNIQPIDPRFPTMNESFRLVTPPVCDVGANRLTYMKEGMIYVDQAVKQKYYSELQVSLIFNINQNTIVCTLS